MEAMMEEGDFIAMPDKDGRGVWFESLADGSRTKITEHLGINRGTELFGLIPPLAAGSYRLEIVTLYTGSTPLKEPRTIKAEPLLTVA